eukprot:5428877-Prymnesium_polylepis.2
MQGGEVSEMCRCGPAASRAQQRDSPYGSGFIACGVTHYGPEHAVGIPSAVPAKAEATAYHRQLGLTGVSRRRAPCT